MNTIFKIALILVIAKAASFLLFISEPKYGIEKYPVEQKNLPYSYVSISSLFQKEKNKQTKKPKIDFNKLYPLKDFQLIGVVIGYKKAAVIKDRNRQQVLLLGESYKNYKLIDVLKNKAIFEKNHKRYVASLKDLKSSKFIKNIVTNHKKPPEDVLRIISKKDIHKYKKNFNEIWNNIGISELKKGNKIIGFFVSFIRKGSIFDKVGLQPGDIIKKVNNIELDSYKKVYDIYNNIDKYKHITITIIRNNQEKELEYEIY